MNNKQPANGSSLPAGTANFGGGVRTRGGTGKVAPGGLTCLRQPPYPQQAADTGLGYFEAKRTHLAIRELGIADDQSYSFQIDSTSLR